MAYAGAQATLLNEGGCSAGDLFNAKPAIASKRKPQRRKPKNKLAETYPVYLQEAFFGRDLLDVKKSTSALIPGGTKNHCFTYQHTNYLKLQFGKFRKRSYPRIGTSSRHK